VGLTLNQNVSIAEDLFFGAAEDSFLVVTKENNPYED
jgi:hypothetical protein